MIIDCHTHFDQLEMHDRMLSDMDHAGIGPFAILVVGLDSAEPDCFKQPHAFWFKLKHPDRVFVLGGLDFTGMFDKKLPQPHTPLVEQVQALIDVGADGLKLLFGKPDRRKWLGQPVDSPSYTPMFNLLEQTGFPVLWHVNDPPEFWSPDTVPLWARQNKWWYDETHASYSQIERELHSTLRRHPRLNLIIPHFCFYSDRLDKAAQLLDTYPRLRIDLAPGIEMFYNFKNNFEASREFFIRYADRIVFGTDTGLMNQTSAPERPLMVRRCLEATGTVVVPEDPCMTPDERGTLRGLALPESAAKKILGQNFVDFVGSERPKPLNKMLLKQMLSKLSRQAKEAGEKTPTAERVAALL